MAWQLRPDVFLADVRGDLVFMNAASNEYSCIPRSGAEPVRSLLAGCGEAAGGDELLAKELASAGLIEKGDVRPLPRLEMTARADFHDIAAPRLGAGPHAWACLIASALEAAFCLRFFSPARWLRRQRAPCEDGQAVRAATLALQFDRLRPLFPGTGRCLPNSMFLLSYLRRHGIGATWVFGVQTFPFEAHCWVEHEGIVLNDTIEHVRWYTPIAVA